MFRRGHNFFCILSDDFSAGSALLGALWKESCSILQLHHISAWKWWSQRIRKVIGTSYYLSGPFWLYDHSTHYIETNIWAGPNLICQLINITCYIYTHMYTCILNCIDYSIVPRICTCVYLCSLRTLVESWSWCSSPCWWEFSRCLHLSVHIAYCIHTIISVPHKPY